MAAVETMTVSRPRPISQLNRKVYLGLYDSRSWPEPDSRDEQRVRDYMVQKYENKRWYVAPTEAQKEEAKRANEAALNSKPQVKPLRSLLGENAPKLNVGAIQTPPATSHPHAPAHVSVPLPGAIKTPIASVSQPAAQTQAHPAPAKPSGFDLLGDLGGDPFASSAPATNSHSDSGGFADFSNFDSFTSAPSQPAVAPPTQAPPPQAFPISNTPLQPLGRGQAPTPTTAPQQPPAQAFSMGGDKYAALADLDSAFSAPTTTATSINWGGLEGGVVNWGGTSSAAGTPSQSTAATGWASTSAGSGPINWNSQGSAGMSMGSTPPSGGFGAPATAANPFGGVPNAGMPAFSSAAPSSTVNPFGAGGVPTSMPVSQFSQAGGGMMGGMPVSTSAGFGGQFAVQGQPAGFGQFPPMQNGGFGMAPTSAGFGASPAFSQQQFMMSGQPGAAQQAGGWGQMGAMPPHQGVPSQPVANPFMNTAMHQQVPPPSGSTNPFL